jgi:hypothetical protein
MMFFFFDFHYYAVLTFRDSGWDSGWDCARGISPPREYSPGPP